MAQKKPSTTQFQEKCKAFFIRHPEYFIDVISFNYPFSVSQLITYKDSLNWSLILQNTNIQWNADIIHWIHDYNNWDIFSTNESAFKDLTLLETFSDVIDWSGDDSGCGDSISSNEGLCWDMDLIRKYESKINFEKLSSNSNVQWTDELLDKYRDKWNYVDLGCNESIPWTLELFDKYLGVEYFFYFPIQSNEKMLSNFDLLEKYKDYVNWGCVCSNSNLPWKDRNLLEYWKERIDWGGISRNKLLFQNGNEFFQKNMDKWSKNNYYNFQSLSYNQVLPWSKLFIEEYKNYWDWTALCQNRSIPWSIDLIDYFSKYIKWGGWYESALLDECGNEIAPTGGKFLQFGLVHNHSLPWTIGFLEHFEDNLEFEALRQNNSVWEKAFKHIVNDHFIESQLKNERF